MLALSIIRYSQVMKSVSEIEMIYCRKIPGSWRLLNKFQPKQVVLVSLSQASVLVGITNWEMASGTLWIQ